MAEVLPLLYLHGLSTGDFQEVLPTLLAFHRGDAHALEFPDASFDASMSVT
jgi:ubiquinone/menaquinone biosynthesis C-methylase UbiE